jgi:hypothetical protein
VSGDEIDDIVTSYLETGTDGLPKSAREKIAYFKDRIANIAKNSSMKYEDLALLAKNSMVSFVSDVVLLSKPSSDRTTEEIVGDREIQQHLLRSLGPKRLIALKLHSYKYTNPEIAQALFEIEGPGGTGTRLAECSGYPISRSAVKNLIVNTLRAVGGMEIFAGEVFGDQNKDENT